MFWWGYWWGYKYRYVVRCRHGWYTRQRVTDSLAVSCQRLRNGVSMEKLGRRDHMTNYKESIGAHGELVVASL